MAATIEWGKHFLIFKEDTSTYLLCQCNGMPSFLLSFPEKS